MTLLINHSVSEGIYVESLLGAAFIFCAEGEKKKESSALLALSFSVLIKNIAM